MSRIHEALQKARNQEAPSRGIPDTDEIIVTGTAWTPEPAADPLAQAEPLELLPQSPESSQSLLAQCRKSEWKIAPETLVFLGEDGHAFGQEQFRTLRSRLYNIRSNNNAISVLVVSSSVPDEGKSFVSCNLAHAFAIQSGRRALLIDADLRRPDGSTSLLGAPKSPGLTEYLRGDAPLSAVLQTGPIDNLYLIPCGEPVANAGELVAHEKLETLLEQLRPVFDWIVIDTPPVLPVADARVAAELADGVLLVVNAQSTNAKLAKRATSEFETKRILGVVLNKTADVTPHYYSHYGYDQHKSSKN